MDWAEKRSWMERAGRQLDPKIHAKIISNLNCFFGGTLRYARQTALVVESGLSVATGPRCGRSYIRIYLNCYLKLMLHSGLLVGIEILAYRIQSSKFPPFCKLFLRAEEAHS